MPRKRIRLSQFRIDVHEPIAELVHYYRHCDWSEDVYGMTPGDVTAVARRHARECDGQPQPRPQRDAGARYGLVPGLLSEQLMAALTDSLTQPDRGLEAYLAEFGADRLS
jgi:hypothetical protein